MGKFKKDSDLFVHRFRINFRVCSIFKANRNRDSKTSYNRFERKIVEWGDYFDCLASHMWADLLTKETKLPKALEDILTKNIMKIENATINEVKAHGHEVRMSNIQNRTKAGIDTLDSQHLLVSQLSMDSQWF